ncbi:hypothetical protein QQP08_011736 [Theobroma cacao]|nr:hypothetical protein QQP08_011736 [Theobroma cacao]
MIQGGSNIFLHFDNIELFRYSDPNNLIKSTLPQQLIVDMLHYGSFSYAAHSTDSDHPNHIAH